MIRLITLACILTASLSQVNGQCLLPNTGFENWSDMTDTFEFELDLELVEEVIWPDGYSSLIRLVDLVGSSIIIPFFDTGKADRPLFDGVSRVEPGANGSASALQIQSDSEIGRYDVLTTIECLERPTALKGWYRYSGEGVDTLRVLALFHGGDLVTEAVDAVASASFVTGGGPEEFTEFNVPFDYPTELDADSMTLLMIVTKDENSDAIGSFQIDDISLEGISTAVADIEVSHQLVAPNPAHDRLDILAPGIDNIQVLNFSGQTVLNIQQAVSSVNIGDLVPGTYIARSIVAERVLVQKFIKL